MGKVMSWFALACVVILFGIVVFYTPDASSQQIEKFDVTEQDGKIHIEGSMQEGYMYRGYKVDSLAGNYFLTIKRGLVGNRNFTIDVDEESFKKENRQPLERMYTVDKAGDKTLIYGEE